MKANVKEERHRTTCSFTTKLTPKIAAKYRRTQIFPTKVTINIPTVRYFHLATRSLGKPAFNIYDYSIRFSVIQPINRVLGALVLS